MLDKTRIKVPNHVIADNGEKLFFLDHYVSTERRETPPIMPSAQEGVDPNNQQNNDSGADNSDDADANSEANDDGLVRQKWRLLSCVQAWPSMGWYPVLVDYSHEGGKAIKAIPRLVNTSKPDLMKNHSDDVNNIVGHIEQAEWEDSSDIPPGANGVLVIDPEFDQKAAIALQKGIFRSGSIGITGQFKKSHEDMDDYEFMVKQGKKVKGEIVRFLPVKITSVRHMAIVPGGAGADANAGTRAAGNTANHQSYNTPNVTGGRDMLKKLLDLINKAAGLLKLDPMVDNSEIPAGFEEKVIDRIKILHAASEERNSLVLGLQAIGEQFFKDDNGLAPKAAEVLNRIPARLEKAKNGDRFVEHQRSEALKAFDAARVDPAKPELSSLDKKLRARIENSGDLDFLAEELERYQEEAKERFGLNRSSEAEDLKRADGEVGPTSLDEAEIRESAQKLHANK